MSTWLTGVEKATTAFLYWRKRRKFLKKEKQKKKYWLVDWIEAFLWAALVVLLINQFFFQAYQIPSGSMKNTLLIKDRIFVNKYVYGPELAPGVGKLPGYQVPRKGDVIIFENPSYNSKGTAFDIIQRVLYMVTLSMVDIDRDKDGNPRAHFLIKRAAAAEHDRLRFVDGEVEFLSPGTGEWRRERDLQRYNMPDYEIQRLIQPSDYPRIHQAGAVEAYKAAQLPEELVSGSGTGGSAFGIGDTLEWNKSRYRALYSIYPMEKRYRSEWLKRDAGWYLPDNWILPLGDNRDNSRDGRYFGPVHQDEILGRAMFIYLPLHRMGPIE